MELRTVEEVLGAPVHRISAREFQRMLEAGVLRSEERLELLDGILVEIKDHSPRHALAVERLNVALIRTLSDRFRVRCGLPMVASNFSVPQPDLIVSARDQDADRHPRLALWIVEVSHSSLRKDQNLKLRIYAKAKVPEYWVVNVRAGVIEVYRKPSKKTGTYAEHKVYPAGAKVKPAALPGPTIDVAALFA
jgi:Uma2 family endonuclease